MFNIYTSTSLSDPANCIYSTRIEVSDDNSLKKAVSHDYVCAEYKNYYRSNQNFIKSDCLTFDCDNDHSDDPTKWMTPDKVAKIFFNVKFAVHYSRNHLKNKGDKIARPKFHVFFPIDLVTDAEEYRLMKEKVLKIFPFFDRNAKDAARFFFGTENPATAFFNGDINLNKFLDEYKALNYKIYDNSQNVKNDNQNNIIPQGCRNNAMLSYAEKILKRHGDTDEAYSLFFEKSTLCSPRLDNNELDSIWNSAKNFYNNKIAVQDGYILPAIYNQALTFKPEEMTDVGQAKVFTSIYHNRLLYSPATGYLVYNGSFWDENDIKAQGFAQELTAKQLNEAEANIAKAQQQMNKNGAWKLLKTVGESKAAIMFTPPQEISYNEYKAAEDYKKYALNCQKSEKISCALKEARPMLLFNHKLLDANEFLLNTPSLTYDLSLGINGGRTHNPDDRITKETAVDASDKGAEKWQEALNTFFCNDKYLIDYVQRVVGLAAIGKVYVEALIIAYGEGSNGKSTFWNTILRVLGTYGGTLSSEVLTAGFKGNAKPELAEARGKRLIIASELEESSRLSTSRLKQLCSTDEITAEKKYKDPLRFTPTHTLVLYTNYLPKVNSRDQGTWRRLIVIPFNARLEGQSDVKNYADFLFQEAGEAVLSWIIRGAELIIADKFKLEPPEVVQKASSEYHEINDWLKRFIDACLDIGDGYTSKAGDVYACYKFYCEKNNEHPRSNAEFGRALSTRFKRDKGRDAFIYHGFKRKDVPLI